MRYFLAVALIVLCGKIDSQTFNETLTDHNCTILLEQLSEKGVLDELEKLSDVTLFAPNDEAMKDKNLTQDDLLYHAVEGLIKFSDITHEFVENSVAGSRIRFNSYDDDKEKTAQGVLIDSKNVDLAVTNGSIHVLTAVMSPPSSTIYEWIENNSKFTQLKDAIDKAELKEIFNNDTASFTLFAPNDEAFNKVPDGDLDDLTNDTLKAILSYHATERTHFSIDINNGDKFESLAEDHIVIVAEGGNIYINQTGYAEVIELDKSVTNGVIHVINRVLKMDVVNGSTTLSIQTSIIISLLTLLLAILQF